MTEKKELLNRIGPDVDRIEKALSQDIESLKITMDELLVEIIEYGVFSGGKRFRPLLAVMAFRLCGGKSSDIYPMAIGFEYLHLATLFHDDVIDRSDMRRGKPSVCRAYGTEAAILAGDFLHARAMALVGGGAGSEALRIFCTTTEGMVNGEYIQLRNAKNYNQSVDDYFEAIKGKTALLIAAAVEIGGMYGGGGKEQQHALSLYGSHLGYGFQIADDLLDYLGDEQITGKPIGNDLADGKMTLPLIVALERAKKGDKELLLSIIADPDRRKNEFERVGSLIEHYDGFSTARAEARKCIDRAMDELGVFTEDSEEKGVLRMLAQYALTRKK